MTEATNPAIITSSDCLVTTSCVELLLLHVIVVAR